MLGASHQRGGGRVYVKALGRYIGEFGGYLLENFSKKSETNQAYRRTISTLLI